MLETARIGGDAGPYRSVAQLVEHRSPKPGVAGSSPATPASEIKYLTSSGPDIFQEGFDLDIEVIALRQQ